MGDYDVLLGDQAIGKVHVGREGLYYRFSCRCELSGEVIYKLTVSCGEHEENLGILVPMGPGFGLETKLAAKRLGEGELRFRALPKRAGQQGEFVPVYPDEPFRYIARLKDAYLEKRNGQVGVVIKNA